MGTIDNGYEEWISQEDSTHHWCHTQTTLAYDQVTFTRNKHMEKRNWTLTIQSLGLLILLSQLTA